MRDYKLARDCTDCGWREHPAALQFDHLPGTQKVAEVSLMLARFYLDYFTEQDIWDEIAKCEVVCANHHAIRTAHRLENT